MCDVYLKSNPTFKCSYQTILDRLEFERIQHPEVHVLNFKHCIYSGKEKSTKIDHLH